VWVRGPCFREPAGKGSFFSICQKLTHRVLLSCCGFFCMVCLEQIHECSGFCCFFRLIFFFLLEVDRVVCPTCQKSFFSLRIDDSFFLRIGDLRFFFLGLCLLEKCFEGKEGHIGVNRGIGGEGGKLRSVFCLFKVRGISLAVSLRGIHRLCFLEELTSRLKQRIQFFLTAR